MISFSSGMTAPSLDSPDIRRVEASRDRFADLRLTTRTPEGLANDFNLDQRSALLDEVEVAGGGIREVNDVAVRGVAVGHGTAIIDRDANGLSVPEIRDAHFRAAAKFRMRRGQLRGRVRPAARGLVTFERSAVERSVTALRLVFPGAGLWRRRFLSPGFLSSGLLANDKQGHSQRGQQQRAKRQTA